MNKVTDIAAAIDRVHSGDTVMIGGFASCGTPLRLLSELEKRDVRHLTTISEDCSNAVRRFGLGLTQLVKKNMVDEIIVSFFGNREAQEKIDAGELRLTMVPQGTLAERIRAGGAGLGGFYTPVGVGTVVEEGKERRVINGKSYLLELPLRADVALIKCRAADPEGNAVFAYTARNFSCAMATAADFVILECEELLPPGGLIWALA